MRRQPTAGVSVSALIALVALCFGVSGCGGSASSSPSSATATAASTEAPELRTLIEAENAAVYGYGVIGAHLTGSPRARALVALSAHRQLRDAWINEATASEQEIPPAAIAYDLPIEVRDAASAEQLAVQIETRLIAVYEQSGEIAAEALAKAQARLARLTSSS